MKLFVECGGIRIFVCVQNNWQKRQKIEKKNSIFRALPWQHYKQNLTDISFENKKPWRIHLSTCRATTQAGCIERVVHHSHENQKFYLFKIDIDEKLQKPKLMVKAIMVTMATAVKFFFLS